MSYDLTCQLWEQALRGVHSRLAFLFHSVGSQHRCLDYLRGLLSDVERKNGWANTRPMTFNIFWNAPIGRRRRPAISYATM
uniref:hypothetical protein n=1 Tax=Xenorhabdus sp. KK7.4 TaxID=1851572 RepID=UPI0019D47760|nr:hypothetical protein [Xenorhabdus sp. KK7.4]